MSAVLSPRLTRVIRVTLLVTGLLVTPVLGLGLLGAAPGQETVVRCEPEVVAGDIGSSVSFTIYVEDVAELYGADVQMSFDTSIAQVVDANPARPGTQIEMLDELLALDFVIRDVADNAAGTIWYANTQVNPTEAVSGSGALARVTMQPVKAGSFAVPFTNAKLVRRGGGEIPSIARDCRVAFFDPNATLYTYLPIGLAP